MLCMTQGDIHNLTATLQANVNKISENSSISQRDKDILVNGVQEAPSFLTYLRNQGMSKSRIMRYVSCWNRIDEFTDWDIEEVDKNKMSHFIGQIHQDEFCKRNGDPFADSTKREYKKSIRKMYTDYLEEFKQQLRVEDEYKGEELINFTLTIDRSFTDSDRLPTPSEVKSLVENMEKIRDKAYLMMLWSTGGRHGEVLGLKWKDVKFTNSVGKVIFRDTKTGGDHTVPMSEAYPFIKRLRENDPKSGNPSTYLFRSSTTDTQLSATGASNILKRAKEETDISEKIKVNPHAFRKGRTSYWGRQGKNESWICKHMNWAQGNAIVRHYCRISREDVETDVAEHLGLEHQDRRTNEESKILTPSECYDCGAVNSFEADVCEQCGSVLDSGELFVKAQIEEKSVKFMEEVIKSETQFDPEGLDQKAEEFVEEELGLD